MAAIIANKFSVPNGPPPLSGLLVRTGLMILLIVLDQFRIAVNRSGLIVLMVLCWSLNSRKCDVDLSKNSKKNSPKLNI